MTSLTAPMTSSSPHFFFRSSTNCFHFLGIVICVVVCRLHRSVDVCVDVCIVICIVICMVAGRVVAHCLRRGVLVCIAALSSASQSCCLCCHPLSASRHHCLRRGIVVCVEVSCRHLRRGIDICIVVHCLRHSIVVCGCVICRLPHGIIVCVDGADNNNAHHCHSHRYCH
jgi:hypothetical protein